MISLCRKVLESIFPPPNRSRNENQTKIPLHDSTRLFETLSTYVLRTTNEEAEIRSPNCSIIVRSPSPSRTYHCVPCCVMVTIVVTNTIQPTSFSFPSLLELF